MIFYHFFDFLFGFIFHFYGVKIFVTIFTACSSPESMSSFMADITARCWSTSCIFLNLSEVTWRTKWRLSFLKSVKVIWAPGIRARTNCSTFLFMIGDYLCIAMYPKISLLLHPISLFFPWSFL